MPRRQNTPIRSRRSSHQRADDISTAFLLPDLHPWLREFFAHRNLIPIRDGVWGHFPEWEPVPERNVAAASIQCAVSGIEYGRNGASEQTPALTSIPNTEYPIPNTGITEGARRSTAPVPFIIPVDVAAVSTPSRHFLRILRPHPTPVRLQSPNLLATIQEHFDPIREQAVERARAPAPTVRIPAPFNELLIVNITIGPLGVLWRSVGWPILSLLGITGHGSRIMGLARSCQVRLTRLWLDIRQPGPERLWMLPKQRERPAMPLVHAVPWRHRFAFAYTWTPRLCGEGVPAAGRHAFAFAIVLTIVLLPLKLLNVPAGLHISRGRVLGATADALGTFQDGGVALAHSSFAEAIAAFDRAQHALEVLPQTGGAFVRLGLAAATHLPGLQSTTLGRADAARRAGVALAAASSAAARGLASLERADLADPHAGALLDAATASFTTAHALATDAQRHLQGIAPQFVGLIDQGAGELQRATRLLPILKALGGIDHPRRILLVFQNPAELRPTGGFIGSLALVDVAAGGVEALEIPGGGSYDISGIARLRVIPPEPLRLLQATWQFQDANWFPDFPTSARKLRAFYEAGGGPTVDAVVAVNAPVLGDILALTGPVTVAGQPFSASTAVATLTDTIESTRARATGKPKEILGALAPEVLRRLLTITAHGDTAQRIAIMDRLIRALEERDIILTFTDDAVQRHVVEARWAGEVRSADRDSLFVVHANIGGGKSDASIRDDITHTATIAEDGSLIDAVTVTRTHHGVPAAANASPSERLAGLVNVDYVRVYVPRGAVLLAAEGSEPPSADTAEPVPSDAIPDRLLLATELNEVVDPVTHIRITEEFGKTVFGGWLHIPPGTTRSLRFTYRLPWRYERVRRDAIGRTVAADPQPYSLTVQKQPGTRATIRHTVTLAPTWRATWNSENLQPQGAQIWALADLLTSDRMTGMMIAPK